MDKVIVELADDKNSFCNCCPSNAESNKYYKISFLIGVNSTSAIFLCDNHLKELSEGINNATT